MKHNVVGYIYETKSYDMFRSLKGNREVTENKKLQEEIKAVGILTPIIVNEKYEVIDGQHRLDVARRVGVAVPFIIKKGAGIREVRSINTTSRQWMLRNFIHQCADEGNGEYKTMARLMKKYSVMTGTLCCLAFNQTDNYGVLDKIKGGQLKFFNYNALVDFLEFYEELITKTALQNSGNLPKCLYQLYRLKKFDPKRVFNRANLIHDKLKGVTQQSVMTQIILECYNRNLSEGSNKEIKYYISSKGFVEFFEELKPSFKKKE